MRYFTIGPVQMSQRVIRAGGQQARYFRDQDFADDVMHAQDRVMEIVGAKSNAQIAVLSGSGTAAMEAAVINFTRPDATVLAINGGSFGERFLDIARRHTRDTVEHKVAMGRDLDMDRIEADIKRHRPAAVLMNIHETSTGQLFDVATVGRLCRSNDSLLICDAVSTVGSDPLHMSAMCIDVLLFSSNKGLALSPGAAFVIAGERAMGLLKCSESYYLDLAPYFAGAKRGQPPVTSSIGVLQQLFERLAEIDELGGIEPVVLRVHENARAFRNGIEKIGISGYPQTPSNALTAFVLEKGDSNALFDFLKKNYGFIVNKSAWGLEVDVPRIAHVGDLTIADHTDLTNAIKDYFECT